MPLSAFGPGSSSGRCLAPGPGLSGLSGGLPRRDWNTLLLRVVRKQQADAAGDERQRQARRKYGTHPSRELSAYAGSYEHPAYGTVRVSLEGGVLVWRWHDYQGQIKRGDGSRLPLNAGLVRLHAHD